jgi:microtubule-associated protein-like 5
MEAWRSNNSMLKQPEVDQSECVIQGWGSSFSRLSIKDVKMRLDRVHGYRGYDCRSNLVSCDTQYQWAHGLVIWFVGRVVVLCGDNGRQRFYLQHLNEVACIAKFELDLSQDAGLKAFLGVETGHEGGGRSVVVATAEVGDAGCVHVWDAESLECKAELTHGFAVRQVSLSPLNNTTLVSVGGHEDASILTVWDWRGRSKLAMTHLSFQENVPFLELKCNPFLSDDGTRDQDQASCIPRSILQL